MIAPHRGMVLRMHASAETSLEAMAGRQRIDRVRREYNQWAANQTLEDFALRFTAKRARRWSAAQVGQTALGAVSFLALEAIGGSITLSYGFVERRRRDPRRRP